MGISYSKLSDGAKSLYDTLERSISGITDRFRDGFRSPTQNKHAQGAKRSQHLSGNALDISLRGLSDAEKKQILDVAIAAGAKGIGIYNLSQGGTTLHVDLRGKFVLWSNSYGSIEISTMPDWAKDTLTNLKAGVLPSLPDVSPLNPELPSNKPGAKEILQGGPRPMPSLPSDFPLANAANLEELISSISDITEFPAPQGSAMGFAGSPEVAGFAPPVPAQGAALGLAGSPEVPGFAPPSPAPLGLLGSVTGGGPAGQEASIGGFNAVPAPAGYQPGPPVGGMVSDLAEPQVPWSSFGIDPYAGLMLDLQQMPAPDAGSMVSMDPQIADLPTGIGSAPAPMALGGGAVTGGGTAGGFAEIGDLSVNGFQPGPSPGGMIDFGEPQNYSPYSAPTSLGGDREQALGAYLEGPDQYPTDLYGYDYDYSPEPSGYRPGPAVSSSIDFGEPHSYEAPSGHAGGSAPANYDTLAEPAASYYEAPANYSEPAAGAGLGENVFADYDAIAPGNYDDYFDLPEIASIAPPEHQHPAASAPAPVATGAPTNILAKGWAAPPKPANKIIKALAKVAPKIGIPLLIGNWLFNRIGNQVPGAEGSGFGGFGLSDPIKTAANSGKYHNADGTFQVNRFVADMTKTGSGGGSGLAQENRAIMEAYDQAMRGGATRSGVEGAYDERTYGGGGSSSSTYGGGRSSGGGMADDGGGSRSSGSRSVSERQADAREIDARNEGRASSRESSRGRGW